MKQKLSQFTWRQWLMPRSIDGIGLLLYLGVLGVYSYYTLAGFYTTPYPVLRIMAVLLALLALVVLDRLEYLYYGDTTSPTFSTAWACAIGPRPRFMPTNIIYFEPCKSIFNCCFGQ